MARYVHGNLATKPVIKPEVQVQEPKQPAHSPKPRKTRKYSERSVYILMIVVFVIVSIIVVSRYSAVYDLNIRTAEIEADIEKLKVENNNLKERISQLSDPESYRKDAVRLGLQPIKEEEVYQIGSGSALEPGSDVVINQR